MLKGFVCPKCRLLFSAKADQIGEKASCPSCLVILQIPKLDDSVSPLLPHVVMEQRAAIPHEVSEGYEDNWLEAIPAEISDERLGKLPWHMILPASVIGVVLMACMLMLLGNTENKPVESIPRLSTLSEEAELINAEISEEDALAFLNELSSITDLKELQSKLLPVAGIEEKLATHYKNEAVAFPQIQRLPRFSSIHEFPNRYEVVSIDKKGQKRGCILYGSKAGKLLLDWQAYVQYCDVPWEELKLKKPTELVTIRAIAKKVEYYNNGFSSDEWQAFDLRHITSDILYVGYVRRNSEAYFKLLPIGSELREITVVLETRYSKDAFSGRQLIIENVVQTHWITEFTE